MTKTTICICSDLGDVLSGKIQLDGKMRRMDGSWLFWATSRTGERIAFATPRPNEDQVEVIKERWRNVRGLDPEAGSVQRGAHYIDNDEL